MKKIIALLTAILIMSSLALPAFAAEEIGFVPSIGYKDEPTLVYVLNEEGVEVPGMILDGEGNLIGYLDLDCLQIIPVAQIWDDEAEVPASVAELLLFVYNSLNDGSMVLPYDKFNANLDPDNMVIRDLFDARWLCEDHPAMLAPEGVVLQLTFDLGVAPDAEIYVMSYNEETKEWEPIVKTVNNGDGTVTCTFEHLCAITFSMPLSTSEAPAQSGFNMIWIAVMVLAAVAVVGLLIVKGKKSSAAK